LSTDASDRCLFRSPFPVDSHPETSNNMPMSTETIPHNETMARVQEAAEKAAKGIRDPEAMRKAAEEMDRIGEEVRRKHGILDIGVPAIRELRDR
jgi:hypothetical protein